jgi:NDP-sugar pyrophosphorylase family protein
MLPIAGKPLLEHTINYLKEYEITDIIICVAYLKKQIMAYFGDGAELGIKVRYAEANAPLGTGGQLKTAEKYIDGTFLAMNGDIFTTMNLNLLLKKHREFGGIATIALKKYETQVPHGSIELQNDRIISFVEKPRITYTANAGLYAMEPRVFDYIEPGKPVSLELETFPKIIESERVAGFFDDSAFWADIGTMTDFERVNDDTLLKIIEKRGESSPYSLA